MRSASSSAATCKPDEMIGNWAGELGPTQFTPSDYFKHGVDFDGDGRVDMIHSVPDALASAANLLKSFGWQRGQPWLQEVRVPAQMPWEQADVDDPAPARAMGALGGARPRMAICRPTTCRRR